MHTNIKIYVMLYIEFFGIVIFQLCEHETQNSSCNDLSEKDFSEQYHNLYLKF